MITPQTVLASSAVNEYCQPISSHTTLCTANIITIVVIGAIVVFSGAGAVWLRWMRRATPAAADEEQAPSPIYHHNVDSVSVKDIVQGPMKPKPAKTAEPDVFWSPQDRLPELHFHLDPLPSTDEMTEMERFDFAVRRLSHPFPSTPSPRSSWGYSRTCLFQSCGSTAR